MTNDRNNFVALTFTAADDEIIIKSTKTTSNDVTTLALARIFTCYSARMNIPKVDFLKKPIYDQHKSRNDIP